MDVIVTTPQEISQVDVEVKTAPPAPPPAPVPQYDGWVGIRYDNPPDMPLVIPAQRKDATGWRKYNLSVEFTRSVQLLTWEMFQWKNPTITKNNWRGIMDRNTWGTNFNGWHDDKQDPTKNVYRADWVNLWDTDKPNPYLMDGIVMSGSLLTFREDGEYLVARPDIDGIDVTKPLPSLQEIWDNNWYFYLVNNTPNISHFAQGHGGPVIMPYFLKEETYYNKAYFKRWMSADLPDPLKWYG